MEQLEAPCLNFIRLCHSEAGDLAKKKKKKSITVIFLQSEPGEEKSTHCLKNWTLKPLVSVDQSFNLHPAPLTL